ncbi:hypothetical protein DQ384_36545 [Sphaerisporangium album]|uniref:Uncharacterized protein n=1 Tax=Sphaerisporangium album TaxID=509200 RepID=A0A367ESM6_9ACTN|nr:hypothetical protein [Sphaerisporangium album]RCG21128.1 hypothetical protein DQ384_36545 [Sphaerisporangium album]
MLQQECQALIVGVETPAPIPAPPVHQLQQAQHGAAARGASPTPFGLPVNITVHCIRLVVVPPRIPCSQSLPLARVVTLQLAPTVIFMPTW